MKKALLLTIAIAISPVLFAQDFRTEFEKAAEAQDTTKMKTLLAQWEEADSNDPELYTYGFNYYLYMAQEEIMSITPEKTSDDAYAIKDSLDQTVGYMGTTVIHDAAIIDKAIAHLDRGIALHPNRLDMHFGKIYVLGEQMEWDRYTEAILQAIRRSAINDNQWLWSYGEPLDDPKISFLSSIQDYQVDMIKAINDKAFPRMQTIAEEILKHYPDDVVSMSNLSNIYGATGQDERALEILLKAETIDPDDVIVLLNIAQSYVDLGDKDKAIEYYKKVKTKDEPQAVDFAKEKIKELKKN